MWCVKLSVNICVNENLASVNDNVMSDGCRSWCIHCLVFEQRPSSLRIDQLDKENLAHDNLVFPKIVHFGMKPSRITYVGNPE